MSLSKNDFQKLFSLIKTFSQNCKFILGYLWFLAYLTLDIFYHWQNYAESIIDDTSDIEMAQQKQIHKMSSQLLNKQSRG